MSWKKISEKEVYKNKWMRLTEDKIQNEKGKELTYSVVRKEPFALIIPWDGKSLTLVGQYRYPVEHYSWEFPAGHYEHDSIEETARDELKEEVGLTAGRIEKIAEFWDAPGAISQVCHAFLATELSEGETHFEESEIDMGMRVKKVTLGEFQKMILDGEIKDGPTLTAFGIAKLKKLL